MQTRPTTMKNNPNNKIRWKPIKQKTKPIARNNNNNKLWNANKTQNAQQRTKANNKQQCQRLNANQSY